MTDTFIPTSRSQTLAHLALVQGAIAVDFSFPSLSWLRENWLEAEAWVLLTHMRFAMIASGEVKAPEFPGPREPSDLPPWADVGEASWRALDILRRWETRIDVDGAQQILWRAVRVL